MKTFSCFPLNKIIFKRSFIKELFNDLNISEQQWEESTQTTADFMHYRSYHNMFQKSVIFVTKNDVY